jgi:hypothetical protein
VVSFGGTVGSRAPLISATASKLFRGKQIAAIYGMIAFGGGLGSALGSLRGGLIRDFTGSMTPCSHIVWSASSSA